MSRENVGRIGRLAIGALILWRGRSVAADHGASAKHGRVSGPATNVVGGRIVDPVERFPYMVGFYPSRRCGAVLVHPRVLLTAAHCGASLADFPATVDVGRWNWAEAAGGDAFDTHRIQDHIRHPEWTGTLGTPDFALMLLETASNMTLATLARNKDDAPAGETAVVVGWGRVNDTDTVRSDVLREAGTRIVTDDVCAGYGVVGAASYELCADDVDGQSCNGDR